MLIDKIGLWRISLPLQCDILVDDVAEKGNRREVSLHDVFDNLFEMPPENGPHEPAGLGQCHGRLDIAL
jgi:hypothetical protein